MAAHVKFFGDKNVFFVWRYVSNRVYRKNLQAIFLKI